MPRALAPLLTKAYDAGYKALVKCGDDKTVKQLDKWLWEFDPNSFLPHGTDRQDHKDKQPVYLSKEFENENKANLLVLTDGSDVPPALEKGFERIIDLFDGHNAQELTQARQRWKNYKDQGHALVYWQQQPNGGWKKKAETEAQ